MLSSEIAALSQYDAIMMIMMSALYVFLLRALSIGRLWRVVLKSVRTLTVSGPFHANRDVLNVSEGECIEAKVMSC